MSQQENNFIISSTETAKSVEAEMMKSASAQQTEQDETATSEESETTEQEDQVEETEGSESENSETEQEDESDDQGESKEEEKPKKKNGFKKRIDKLSKRASLAEQERDYWREQALKSQPKQETQANDEQKTATADISDGEPLEENFDSYKDYVKALVKWENAQEKKQLEAKSKQDEAKSEYQKAVQSHNDRINEFKKTQTDFDEVVGDFVEDLKAQKVMISVAVEQAILDSDLSAEITYELAQKPQEFARINSMNALAAAREIGKIEARLSKAKESPQIQKQTKAPAPISPVGKGFSTISKALNDPNISFAEYEKIRTEQLKKRK